MEEEQVSGSDWTLDLIARNQRDAVAPGARATEGFLQGTFSVGDLRDRMTGPGMLVAEVDGQRAGVVLSSTPGAYPHGPPGLTEQVARDRLGTRTFFLYGPAVVDRSFRGQGVLGQLSAELLGRTASTYDCAIAFVEMSNEASRDVHHRLGWAAIGTFAIRDRTYEVLSHPTGPASA